LQNALVLLYQHWRQAVAASSLDAYVRKMVVNVFLEDQRRWWARRVVPVAEPTPRPDPTVDTEGRLDQLAALARMAPGQRAVLVLRYWEGLDVPATAEALGCSTGTLKGR
jgi:DNA-directed RNA polymerase specialized sigma24 family protein